MKRPRANIRVSPLDKGMSIKTNSDLLKLAQVYAEDDKLSLNQIINLALWRYCGSPNIINGKKIIKVK